MKSIYITTILAISTTILFSQNISAYMTTIKENLEFVENELNTELGRCYIVTYLAEANQETLQECFDNIMEYVQILCGTFGNMESGKCDTAELYLRYLYSEMNPSICQTNPESCTAPPRPVF